MTTNYDELRQAAKKSADSWEGSDPSWYILGDFRFVTGKEKPIAPPDAVDAAYIVCASPQAMLAVLDENAALRERYVPLSLRTGGIDEAIAFMDRVEKFIQEIQDREQALRKENVALRAAGERLRDCYAICTCPFSSTAPQCDGYKMLFAALGDAS